MDFLKPNQEYNASLTADYTMGDSTLSVNTVPSNFPSIFTVARGTSKETRFTATGGGAGLLTGVTRLDGADENISSGVSVECMIDTEYITQLESAVFTQANLKALLYAADGGASDTYAITLAVAPSSYTDILGLPISFKANTANTGAATLNVNSLGAKTIKKLNDEDLVTGDVESGQIITVVYDGTNFQLQSLTAKPFTTQDGSQNYAADAGANDTYVITLSPAPEAYVVGLEVNFKANTANTGAATINVNGLGAKTIKKNNDVDLADNDIESGQVVKLIYDGTNFQMLSQIANTSSGVNFATTGEIAQDSTTSATPDDVLNATLTISPTASATVQATASGNYYNASGTNSGKIYLVIDGVIKQTLEVVNAAINARVPFTVTGQATVSSGSRVVKLQASIAGGHTFFVAESNINVIWKQ